MNLTIEMTGISEKWVKVHSSLKLVPGSTIVLENDFLKEIFPEHDQFLFQVDKMEPNNEYIGHLKELTEEDIPKLRTYLSTLQNA